MDEAGWYGLAGRLTRERDECRVEIANLRAELASRQIDVETFGEANRQLRAELAAHYELSLAEGKRREELLAKVSAEHDALRAAARQDAEDRAADIEAAETRGYDCGVNDITRQDAEEKARLREALGACGNIAAPYAAEAGNNSLGAYEACVDVCAVARAALACRPQGEKS
jgi:hypothetical protein